MQHASTIALAIAQFALAANAAVGLDMDDVPTPCKAVCKPIGTLSDKCDVDLKSDIDRDEDHLQNQCICTNQSFDVGKYAALCGACMKQSQKNNKRDDDDDDDDQHADSDDLEDINELLSVCGFSSTSYNSAATSDLSSVTVVVTRPTDISQLTTTIDTAHVGGGAGGGGSGSNATPTSTSSSGMSTSSTSGSNNGGGGGMTTQTTASNTGGGGGGSQQTGGSSSAASGSTSPDNAAPAATARAAYALGGMAAAAYLVI